MNQLNRRRFLQTAGLLGTALLANGSGALAQSGPGSQPQKIHGVNLGGWLVLEKWIKPGLFEGQTAEDEYTLCQALGKEKATALLKEHRDTWITADDFKWLKARGSAAGGLLGGGGEFAIHHGIGNDGLGLSHGQGQWDFRAARFARSAGQPEWLGP